MNQNYSFKRHRRLRSSEAMRAIVRETTLSVDDFIYPIFIVEGEKVKNEVTSMPGVFQISLDYVRAEMEELEELGIRAVMLFGVPNEKDDVGTGAYIDEGIVQEATKIIKESHPHILVVA